MGIAKAWKIVGEVRDSIKALPRELKRKIVSVVLFGSLLRGDFVPSVSDIDLLIVFSNDASRQDIERILKALYVIGEKYSGFSKYDKVIDIPWILEKELPKKGSGKKSIFKFLNIYAFDFVKHSMVLYGRDITSEIEIPDPKSLIIDRAKRILKLLEKHESENNKYMIKILAGEAIRLAQITYGEATIDKRKVLKNFLKYVPDYSMKTFAIKIWREYLSPKKEESPEYIENCKKFIRNTINLILSKHNEH